MFNMSINECYKQNNLITPINSSLSNFENNLTYQNNIKPEEPVICIPKTQKRKDFKIGSFCSFLLILFINSFFLFITIYVFFISTSLLNKYSDFKIISSNIYLKIYYFFWIISGYIFTIGNLYNIFVIFY